VPSLRATVNSASSGFLLYEFKALGKPKFGAPVRSNMIYWTAYCRAAILALA
jgi:hypothetical protein